MKAYIFVETGEVRRPVGDEWFFADGEPCSADYRVWREAHPILRRIEVEVPTKVEVRVDVASCCGCQSCFYEGVNWLATRLGLTLE